MQHQQPWVPRVWVSGPQQVLLHALCNAPQGSSFVKSGVRAGKLREHGECRMLSSQPLEKLALQVRSKVICCLIRGCLYYTCSHQVCRRKELIYSTNDAMTYVNTDVPTPFFFWREGSGGGGSLQRGCSWELGACCPCSNPLGLDWLCTMTRAVAWPQRFVYLPVHVIAGKHRPSWV